MHVDMHARFLAGEEKEPESILDWLDGPVFEPLRNRSEFRKFFLAGGTVCWPNGADIAPETLFSVQGVSERAA